MCEDEGFLLQSSSFGEARRQTRLFLARQRQTAHLAIRPGVRWVCERAGWADLVSSSTSCSALSIPTTVARTRSDGCVSSSSGSVGRNINVGRDLEPVDHSRSGCWRGGGRIGRVGAAGVGPGGRGRSCGAHASECVSVSQYWRETSGLVVCLK